MGMKILVIDNEPDYNTTSMARRVTGNDQYHLSAGGREGLFRCQVSRLAGHSHAERRIEI